jgi:hypothetical protein
MVLPYTNGYREVGETEPIARHPPSTDNDGHSSSQRKPKHHIYTQYFTDKESEMLTAVPENDVISEIYLIRILLARAFAQLPGSKPDGKRTAPALKIDMELFSIFSHSVIVLAGLVALHNKSHDPGSELGDIILESIRELNPWEDLE